MAEVTPFRGIRYNETIALDDVVAPPYDVLSAAQAEALRAKDPHNINTIDLPVLPGQTPDDALYAGAAATFAEWRDADVLGRDDEPSIYLVDQTYRGPDGVERTRRGFIARLRIAEYAERIVLPHERTHAGPKMDRLHLYRAMHADISQIFLLYPDDDGAVGAALEAARGAASAEAARVAHDGDGNTHSMVPVAGEAAARVTAALGDRQLYIADGHHRYETALAYRNERRAAGDHSADTLMVYLCSMEDTGLTVFPTHRLLKDVAVPPLPELVKQLEPTFTVVGEPARGGDAFRAALAELPEHDDPGKVIGLYLPADDAYVAVRLTDPAALDRLVAAGCAPAAAGLSVTILHRLILGETLGVDTEHPEAFIDYVKNMPDALASLESGSYTLGAFLNATLVSEVRAIADAAQVMPQKSTYFYPKLLTGLVVDSLGD